MQLTDYKPYAEKFNDILKWSEEKKPFLSPSERTRFVESILWNRYPHLHAEAINYERQKRKEFKEYRRQQYEGRQTKRLESASVGECFMFIPDNDTGNTYFLACVGMVEKEGYDHGEWGVADRDFKYTVPEFKDPNGKSRFFTGTAVVISKEEFYKQKSA